MSEFKIQEYVNGDCYVEDERKSYIPMFKYEQSGEWRFSLPIRPMYLMTIHDVKTMIEANIKEDNAHGWNAKYQIAQITNSPIKDTHGKVKSISMDNDVGEITIVIAAAGSIYVPEISERWGKHHMWNSAPLIEGINFGI